jgi:prepilin-type N-terminal cleavage/methylation domain-containing protein
MLTIRRKYSGFTVVELLIVIIVIAVLATLVITAYNGVQAKARDAERVTDVEAVRKFLEIYYTENGHYINSLNFTNANASAALQNQLKGLNPQALRAPGASAVTISSWQQWSGAVQDGTADYGYKAYTGPEPDDNCATSDIPDSACTRYEIYYKVEVGNTHKMIKSLYGN